MRNTPVTKKLGTKNFGINAVAAIAVAAVAALSTPAFAQSSVDPGYEPGNYVAPAAGAVTGTVVGLGLYNTWFGTGTAATALGATAGTAAVAGGVAGVGTVALVDAAIQPCRGFHAMFMVNPQECANGVWVGDNPRLRRMR
jgi:hypothetical protein